MNFLLSVSWALKQIREVSMTLENDIENCDELFGVAGQASLLETIQTSQSHFTKFSIYKFNRQRIFCLQIRIVSSDSF